MHRLTARALVFILLLGTFAPFAAAAAYGDQPYAAGAHCARQPLPAHSETTSECPHHKSVQAPDSSSLSSDLRSKPCCDEHACCRSQARTQWADVGLRIQLHQSHRAQEPVTVLATQSYSSEVEHYLPVRAPPVF